MKVFSSLFTNNVNASKCRLSSVVERLPEEQSVSGSIPLDGTSGNSASGKRTGEIPDMGSNPIASTNFGNLKISAYKSAFLLPSRYSKSVSWPICSARRNMGFAVKARLEQRTTLACGNPLPV